MATDVVPALNEAIQTSFKSYVMRDRRISQISSRIRDGTATFADGHDYAERLGENLSKALTSNLTADNLPDGRLYYNIASRTVTPALEENYNLTNDAAEKIQKIVDKKSKIGLGSVRADFPTERINGLIDKMTRDDISLVDALIWLREPIINNCEAFFDDFIDSNAKFREDAGLKAKLIRQAEANCCSWCAALEGVYDYDNAPDDIYRRHEFCRCVVTYQTEKTSQNVWSRKTWQSSPEELQRRENAGKAPPISVDERLSQLEQIERDRQVSEYVQQTGYQRRTARAATLKKDPAQIAAEIERIKERQRRIAGR